MGRSAAARLLATSLGIGLAVFIGWKLEDQALAVLVGIICGVVTGVPTAALLLMAITRRRMRKVTYYRELPLDR